MKRRAIAMLAFAAAIIAQQAAAQPASIGGSFTLTQAPARAVSDADFHGKYLLVVFGYTACPDLCPDTLGKIAQALRIMGSRSSQIQAVFITVDPLHDSPASMARYAALFSPAIIGLSGSAAQIAAVERAYHVYAGPRDPKTGAIAHSAILYIMRPDGSFASALPGDVSASSLADTLLKLASTP